MDDAARNAANCEFSYEFVTGFRHNSKLLYVKEEQQFYRIKSSTAVCIHYLCNVKTCSRRVHIRNGKCFAASGSHNHPNQADLYVELIALNQMKQIARNEDNHLKAKQIFDMVRKKYPNYTFVYKKYERILWMTRKEALQKVRQNTPEETALTRTEDILVNDKTNLHNGQLQSIVQSRQVAVIKPIEPIETTTTRKDKKTGKIITTITTPTETEITISTRTITINTPIDSDKTVEPIAESTAIGQSSSQASTTCALIEKAANELRNNPVLEKLDISTLCEIDANSTLSSTYSESSTEKDSEDCNLFSTKSKGGSGLLTTPDIFDKPDDHVARSTAIGQSSSQASTTCARLEKAANELRNNPFLKKLDISTLCEIDANSTLSSTYSESSTEKDSEDCNLFSPKSKGGSDFLTTPDIFDKPDDHVAQSTAIGQSSSQASATCARIVKAANPQVNMTFDHEIPTTSNNELLPVYMCEADINRLFKSGYIRFFHGKLHYNEPKQH